MESLLELPILMYATARSAHFTLQFGVLNALGSILPGQKPAHNPDAPPEAEVRKDLIELLRQDSRNIVNGVYPVSVLKPESPVEHVLRIPKLMADGIAMYGRRRRGRTTEFKKQESEMLSELPRYYRRNFHFQTDGYLSEHSAALYEHQVEMLFHGSANAMRRMIIPPLKAHFGDSDGRGLRFLEIGAGTGPATRFVNLAFPKARIIATDLSTAYLKQASKKMPNVHRVDFMQSAGEELPFSDGHFDAVYSVFLFHELPMTARKQILAESRRVLKPGGFLGLVDAIQNGDKESFDPLLAQFPVDYHEPFFRDYVSHPMETLFQEAGFKNIHTGIGFFSKSVAATHAG